MRPAAKYIMRTDVCYSMPPPPEVSTMDESPAETASSLKDPQAAQQTTVELSSDPDQRRQQLALLKEYGYDTSQFE